MTDPGTQPTPPWLSELLHDVDRAFEVTGADTPGWPDPHPDRDPLEEEYSRVTDPGKYRILGARVDAWTRALAEAGLAEIEDAPADEWIGGRRPASGLVRVRRLRPLRPGGLSVLLATTLVDGAPFGLDVGLAREGERPVLLAMVPDCGCDACDSGSADLLRSLDDWVLTVARGGVLHARLGKQHATRTLDGWESGGGRVEAWLEESFPVPDGVERWVGEPWREGGLSPEV